ncbi:MAG: DNA-3-methyladenine glycosylase family protein [Acetobacteraceae bacterium]
MRHASPNAPADEQPAGAGREPELLGNGPLPPSASPATLVLPFTPPLDWPSLLAFLAPRATLSVESVLRGGYVRTIALSGATGTVRVQPADQPGALVATVHFPLATALPLIAHRLRRMFDLDADPARIAAHLAADSVMAPLVAARPGLRLPGAWDAFELAVRAILGQQISVGRATALAGKLVALSGDKLLPAEEPSFDGVAHLFPTAGQLARLDNLGLALGMPRARGAAITALAKAAANDPNLFDPCATLAESVAHLCKLPGIGEWTAQYIAMRALHLPDAFPHSDVGLLRAMGTTTGRPAATDLLARAAAWRPFRAYAAMHLWASQSAVPGTTGRRASDGA